jgi:hypothetical protein
VLSPRTKYDLDYLINEEGEAAVMAAKVAFKFSLQNYI